MLSIKEIIVVEGKYDKIRLSQLVDTVIITTDGFGLYNNSEKTALLKRLAKERGVIVLTDSDSAGFRIRNFIKSSLGGISVKHAYIPEIPGKERRKSRAGKEGLLGVEGTPDSVIIDALQKANATPELSAGGVTKADFFEDGLAGRQDSALKRRLLAKKMGLPQRMSANALLDVINLLYTPEQYRALIDDM